MTNQHPITPPPELVQQWFDSNSTYADDIRRAAQWGADQELEACCELLESWGSGAAALLRPARRPSPKPPSLKKQALIHFESFAAAFETSGGDSDLIRCALEQLDD